MSAQEAADNRKEEVAQQAKALQTKMKVKHSKGTCEVVQPGSFEPSNHFYPRVLNAQIHPLVGSFMRMSNQRIATRYHHLNPSCDKEKLLELLAYKPRFFRWAGSDLFMVTDSEGNRTSAIVETNSCPSGQKSMPFLSEDNESGGYNALLANTFVPFIREQEDSGIINKTDVLAVIFDKNPMEASGYAAELATIMDEPVYLVEWFDDDEDPPAHVTDDGVLTIRADGEWKSVRAAFRYVTQKPWTRLPIVTKTLVLNPVIACLGGGRNKMVAAKAYEMFNAEFDAFGLQIRVPQTILDLNKNEIPLWMRSFGGKAVVKNPYSNAGQGVYTITNPEELKTFMDVDHKYDKFIMQSLVGNSTWTSQTKAGTYYHIGTVPDKNCKIYVADLRLMVNYNAKRGGFAPLCVYARRAASALTDELKSGADSWSMLGTNLSYIDKTGHFATDTGRLMLMDSRDFNKLGIGIDDLIDGFIQSTLCAVAIDKITRRLMNINKDTGEVSFNAELFFSLNPDNELLAELKQVNKIDLGGDDDPKGDEEKKN